MFYSATPCHLSSPKGNTQFDGGANAYFMDIAFALELGVPTMKYEHLANISRFVDGHEISTYVILEHNKHLWIHF